MKDDPIVEEVRRIREEMAQSCNYDIHAIFADLRARQQTDDPAHPLVQDVNGGKEILMERFQNPL